MVLCFRCRFYNWLLTFGKAISSIADCGVHVMEDAACSDGLAGLSNRDLAARITELAGHLNAATHRWLVLITEFDRRHGWSDGFTKSCAHWLNWKCGIDLGAAREKLRVARALESLPQISAAMATGQLSYSKVRALTRVATPATESLLLDIALHGTAHHVEKLVRQFRRVQEVEELTREARQQANRSLTYRYDEDGSMHLSVRLPAEAGSLVLKALRAAMPEAPNGFGGDCSDPLHVSAETPPPSDPPASWAQRQADALAVLAESFLAHGADALKGGDRQQIVVHVSQAALSQGERGRCELDDGPAIAVETARRLGCDASRVDILEDDSGEPLDVGRRTRASPPAIRRALDARDKGCIFPGWFVRPDGEAVEGCAPGHTLPFTDWTALPKLNVELGLNINSHTAATGWRGECMDYGIAIGSLLYRARKATAGRSTE
jgi:hypothetical protein